MNVVPKGGILLFGGIVFLHLLFADVRAAEPLPGQYEVLEGERSLHTPGRVLLLEFADFYCPHCHLFEKAVVSRLAREFGERLDVRLVGFPVIRGKLTTAFEMYEQARAMGKGSAMKTVLFRTIHKEKIHVLDRSLRSLLLREVGLDAEAFEEGLAGGEPYKALEKSRAWGKRIRVKHTPTVVLDGNLMVPNLDIDNLRTLINGILKKDKTP